MLDAADFGRNPHGPEFGEFGLCRVRFGKAKKGSPPKRRSVLTVWDWTPDVLDEWFTEVRPLFGADGNPAAWPSERGPADRAASGSTPASSPTARPSAWTTAWTSIPSAGPTSPT